MSTIKKAAEYQHQSTLVFGENVSGRTTAVINDIIDKGLNPLWVALSHVTTLSNHPVAKNWDVAVVMTQKQWLDDVFAPARSGELNYSALVIDGIDMLMSLYLPPNPTQKDWGSASRDLSDSVLRIMDKFQHVYIITSLVDDAEGDIKFGINRFLRLRLFSLAGNKWFCYTTPLKKDGVVVGVNYHVQTDPALALRLVKKG